MQSFGAGRDSTKRCPRRWTTTRATDGTSVPFRVRAYKSKAVGLTNPSFEGTMIPQPYTLFGGAAGSASEVDLDWIMDNAPDIVTDADRNRNDIWRGEADA